jgi:uncharacterized protein YbjT (DUF2867 family)
VDLLTQHAIIEQALRKLPMAITFLRPAWFMENSSWDVAPAKNGAIQSFLQPLDKAVPMVATSDIGRLAAELLQETWNGHRVIELEGPHRVTSTEIAATLASLLGRPVRVERPVKSQVVLESAEMKIEMLVPERTSPQAKTDRFSFIWLSLIAEEYLKMAPRQRDLGPEQ